MSETQLLTPLVSIGMPVYNGEKYIRRALDSLLAQDYQRFELIVSDNASTDRTADICREYAANDSRVRFFRNESNLGSIWNFKRVLELSGGKYFTWVAHDDTCDRRYLSIMAEFLENNPDVILCGSSVRILEDTGEVIRIEFLSDIYSDVPWNEARQSFFNTRGRNVYFAIYGVYKRETLRSVPILERKYRGRTILDQSELPVLSRLALQGRIVALPEPIRSYTAHRESSWNTERASLTPAEIRLLEEDMRVQLFWIAVMAPLPFGDRVGLVHVTLRNFTNGLPSLAMCLWRKFLSRGQISYAS